MEKLKEKLGIQGSIKVTIDRADGNKEVFETQSNTIAAALKQRINDQFHASSDFALNALFNGVLTTPTIGEDGIIIQSDASAWYETVCTRSEPTATTTKVTGVFTGVADTFISAKLGFNFIDDDNFTVAYATPTAWNNVILAVADTLTIEWTIDCAP